MTNPRDHGGGLDAAVARHGGARADWLDLSTGINPVPYPIGDLTDETWSALPDACAVARLEAAARSFWGVPEEAGIVAAPGASALIARMPDIAEPGDVHVPGPTYNEHAAAFRAAGRKVSKENPSAAIHVYVHPNNPDGRLWPAGVLECPRLAIVDESFCDTIPKASHVPLAARPGIDVLKSFGKFWGLAGLRLGFAISRHGAEERRGLADLLGPWPISGPALEIGARALEDVAWAEATRARLRADSGRLDRLMEAAGAQTIGGAQLFRLYEVDDARTWRDRLACGRIWSRVFPYSKTWLRLGLPAPDHWPQLEAAL